MKRLLPLLVLMGAGSACHVGAQGLKVNDQEYFERQGVNVLVYSNLFSGGFNDEKNSGIELIHHGVRTAQGGAIRLSNTPEQWDLVPETTSRKVDASKNTIEVSLRYKEYDFDSKVVVEGKGDAVEVSVWLDKPVPKELEGDAGFNIEFLPSQYWNKSYLVDGKAQRLPRYAVSETVARPNSEKVKQFKGYKTYDDRGTNEFIDPKPLSVGHSFLLAPEEPSRMVKISSSDSEISLFDGRMLAQNGWYVFRSVLPTGKTGKVMSWTIEPHAIDGWVRKPNIGFSQVGYLPGQTKVAVIELDKMDKVLDKASLYKIEAGKVVEAFTGAVKEWGRYFKYNYAKFDFSKVTEPGIYYIQYGDEKTENFIIGDDVYAHITDATSDVWIPIHMDHMAVNEGYRVWHGEPFKEGYLQAPVNTDHFDLHSQGPTTATKYKPLELIPGLNVGGYFDAGDFDIETGSNISVVMKMVEIWERYKPMRDETFVSQEQRYVDLHRPDGKPDMLQYIEHGVLNLLAQAEQIGHMAQTLSNSVLDNYHHLGDAASITDGLHYDPSLKPYEVSADGKSSGTPDDMWAFTDRNPDLDARAATMFAAASRVLRGFNDDLAERALKESKRLQKEANELMKKDAKVEADDAESLAMLFSAHPHLMRGVVSDMAANLQLYVATGDKQYIKTFEKQIWPALDHELTFVIANALDAIPYMDSKYVQKLKPYIVKYKEYLDGLDNDNPYGVPVGLTNWAGNGGVIQFGINVCLASKHYPEIIDQSYACKVAGWLYGCHPYHNYSFVATVGATRPKAVFYGNNRADFSFIPGNVAPGVLFRKPDHFENYDDWPFLWGQNEGTIANNTSYLNFGHAFKQLVEK